MNSSASQIKDDQNGSNAIKIVFHTGAQPIGRQRLVWGEALLVEQDSASGEGEGVPLGISVDHCTRRLSDVPRLVKKQLKTTI